jgi:hypothetical protein
MNCSMCHGTLDNQPSPLEKSFYPPALQLIHDPQADPEWRVYYAVRSGVRYKGMPAWNKALSDQDSWKGTTFLARMQTLPLGVWHYWNNRSGLVPQLPVRKRARTSGDRRPISSLWIFAHSKGIAHPSAAEGG